MAWALLGAMARQHREGARFTTGRLGFYGDGDVARAGCCFGAYLALDPVLCELTDEITETFMRRFQVARFYVIGVQAGFDDPRLWLPERMPERARVELRGRTVGVFLNQWVSGRGAWLPGHRTAEERERDAGPSGSALAETLSGLK